MLTPLMTSFGDKRDKTPKAAWVFKAYCRTALNSVVVEWPPAKAKGGPSSKRTLVVS